MMRILVFSIAAVAMFAACTSNNNQKKETVQNDSSHNSPSARTNSATVETALNNYLDLKNGLASDNGTAAATAGKSLAETIAQIDTTSFTQEQKAMFHDVVDDIKEHGEHISANGNKIAHQREHFEMLSTDMYDLMKLFKPNQTVYVDHCPMYNKGKGANWLSETKDIKNPYYGKEMPDCGTVKDELKK